MRTTCLHLIVMATWLGFGGAATAQTEGRITFTFSGFIEFQQSAPVAGLTIGDTFHGSFTFDPLTPRRPLDFDNTLDSSYSAVTAWDVNLSSGLSFSGSIGEIALGNNTPWFLSDRYIVTMWPQASPPILVAGHTFTFFQIDLFDFGNNVGGDMLRDSSLPTQPPDLARIPPYDAKGRFVFNDASFQNRMTSLTLVPEPSPYALGFLATAGLCVAHLLRRGAKAQGRRG